MEMDVWHRGDDAQCVIWKQDTAIIHDVTCCEISTQPFPQPSTTGKRHRTNNRENRPRSEESSRHETTRTFRHESMGSANRAVRTVAELSRVVRMSMEEMYHSHTGLVVPLGECVLGKIAHPDYRALRTEKGLHNGDAPWCSGSWVEIRPEWRERTHAVPHSEAPGAKRKGSTRTLGKCSWTSV